VVVTSESQEGTLAQGNRLRKSDRPRKRLPQETDNKSEEKPLGMADTERKELKGAAIQNTLKEKKAQYGDRADPATRKDREKEEAGL